MNMDIKWKNKEEKTIKFTKDVKWWKTILRFVLKKFEKLNFINKTGLVELN